MIRLPLAVAALAAVVLPATAEAQAMNYYVAVPVTMPAKPRLQTSGTPWFVRDVALVAPRAPERPASVCAMVARKVGALTAFSAGGKPLTAEELATCNAAAPAPAPAA